MAQLPASVTIQQLPTGTTVTGSELIEAVQTSGGQANSVQLSLNQVVSSILGIPVSVSSGGTGTTALTAFGVAFGNGTSDMGVTAPGATALPLVGNGTTLAPSFAVLTVPGGGHGTSTLTAFGVVFGNGTSTIGITAFGVTGLPLIGNGSALAPAFGVASVPGGGTNTSTLTANAVLYGAGTSTVGLLPAGATGQMLMGQGGAPPVMQYPGLTLLNTLTAANSSSLTDTTSFTTTFNDYMLVIESLLPAANGTALTFQLQLGGVLQTAAYINNVGGATTYGDITGGVGLFNGAGNGMNGTLWIFNANNTASFKCVTQSRSWLTNATSLAAIAGSFINTGASTALTGIQIKSLNGTVTSGVVRVYGLRTT